MEGNFLYTTTNLRINTKQIVIKTVEDLISAIHCGTAQEHRNVNIELKQKWDKKYGQDISALGNKLDKDCCWFVVGVDDNSKCVRLSEQKAKKTEEIISQHINDYLDPFQACKEVQCYEINKNWIIVIRIENPGDVVYWDNSAYIASGTTSRVLKPEEILELRIKLPGLSDYSQQLIESEYNQELIESFMQRVVNYGRPVEVGETPLETLKKLNIYGRQISRILLGDCKFRVIKYDVHNEPVDNITYRGLYQLLDSKFQQEIQEWTANQLQLNSKEKPYPERALSEALANAVAHAAYFEKDGEIILELYRDHLSISNLCLRESTYFANRWFSHSHNTINSLLMEVLRIAKHVDELGSGKKLIFSESIRNGKHMPEVFIEQAGRYKRWKLSLYGGTQDKLKLKLLKRIRKNLSFKLWFCHVLKSGFADLQNLKFDLAEIN